MLNACSTFYKDCSLSSPVFYDDSLGTAIRIVRQCIDQVEDTVTYLRDGQGQLHVFVPTELDSETAAHLERELRSGLRGYAPTFGPVLHEGEPSSSATLLVSGERRIKYVERRFAGTDWTAQPAPLARNPPRMVFYSIKGGVGRTTALISLAVRIALKGGNVLCLDLDLEAPGLGQALLPTDQLPEFGALDWLAERAIHGNFGDLPKLSDLVAVSPVTRSSGRIDVIPAFGRRASVTPESVLGKLSRCVLEGLEDGHVATFGTRVSELIKIACEVKTYDVVLIDARAGLSEISAAPLLSLGADVLLFMADNTQSVVTYTALLAYMQRFVSPIERDDPEDWRLRLKAIRGRVVNTSDAQAAKKFLDRVANIFAETIYGEGNDTHLDMFNFAPDDPNAPHFPIPIAFDPRYQTFEPLDAPDQVSPEVSQVAFGVFTQWCMERLGLEELS